MNLRLAGIIGKPHGLHGEVILKFITDYPNSIKRGTIFYIDKEKYKILEVENIRSINLDVKNGAIVKFNGVNDRNSAEEIRGISLFREENYFPVLQQEEYWVDDLIGCSVFTNNDSYIGEVKDVNRNVANDNILVKKGLDSIEIAGIKENEFFIPLIEDYIDYINTDEKKIVLKKIPEYF
ncbi:ribosome maturation factor RimM [bacterium]|nr:ribosome maturation factor RimM [bacterium]